MDSIPQSSAWGVLKKSLPGALGAAAATAAYNFALGARAKAAIDRDKSFPTWSTKNMPSYRKRPRTRRAPRRYVPMVRYRAPMTQYANIRRTTGVYSINIPTSAFNAFTTSVIKLNMVKTSDLLAAYDLYKIRKVQLVVVPTMDPGNSGVVSMNHLRLDCACDPSTTTAPSTTLDITAYDNHRTYWLVAGKPQIYTFYPKVINTVDNAGTTSAAGSYAVNPWLQLTTAGVDIPHRQLQLGASVTLSTGAASGFTVSYYFVIHFAVKNQR